MQDTEVITQIRQKYLSLRPEMDERMRRQWAAAEARYLGWGGVTAVAQATGLSRVTLMSGMRELELPVGQREAEAGRIRRLGAGRPALIESDPELLAALEALIEPTVRGDPESPLRWTCKSTRRLAEELTRQQHKVSPSTVARLLRGAGYSLQANRKTREGGSHPDRNAQFEYINASVQRFLRRGQPAVSVDAKKTITRFNAKLCHFSDFGLKVSYCLLIWLQGGKEHGSSVAEGCGVGRGGVGG